MPVDLYQTRLSGPCRGVLMLIDHLGLDVNIKTVDLAEDEHLKPEFLKMNPAHCVPTLDDNGFYLWESRAIMQYLCNQYAPDSGVYPKDPKKRAIVDRWLNFDMSLITTQSAVIWSKMMGAEPTEDKVTAHKKNLQLLDQLIGSNKYLNGNELTLADLSVLATLSYADIAKYDLSPYTNVERWRTQLKKEVKNYNAINYFTDEEMSAAMEKFKAKMAKQKSQ